VYQTNIHSHKQELTQFESIIPKDGWYTIPSHKSFDNFGLSRPIEHPKDSIFRYVVCVDCGAGPLGYVNGVDFEGQYVYLSKDCVILGERTEKGDEDRVDEALVAQVRDMVKKGKGTTEFSVTFKEARLGMMLRDHSDKMGGVVVGSFTTNELGEIGVAERGGQISVGDLVIGVNKVNTRDMNYAQVLDLIVGTSRPIELHFERKGTAPIPPPLENSSVRRVRHVDWKKSKTTPKEEKDDDEDAVVTTSNSSS
jgi:hypothetical protein